MVNPMVIWPREIQVLWAMKLILVVQLRKIIQLIIISHDTEAT